MRKYLLAISMSLLLITGGCTEEKEQMQRELDTVLNDIQEYEIKVDDYESQLASLEKKEQLLFKKTVELSNENRELIKSVVLRLEESVEKRNQILVQEQEAVHEAEELAKQLLTLPPASSDEGTRAVAKLQEALVKRYELHQEVIDLYSELTKHQGILYEMLIEENVKRVQLEEATRAVNKQRVKVEDAIQVFNQSTNEVNDALKDTQQVES
ncbi:YkyA family protein [Sporosarcina sp. A2]|uniref:YkyA family protein n=1 Tax=Sporosarcina sp. A2 TaxID=3393449 RepID=UPI003D7946A4